jgi:hypothetical protein
MREGVNYQKKVRQIMEQLVVYDVITQYSFTGNKGNQPVAGGMHIT